MHWLRGSLFSSYSMVSGGAWYCPLFAIDFKGGERRFGNRVQSECSGTESSLNGRMQRSVESECKCCHQCQRGRLLENIEQATMMVVVIDGNNGDGRI
jgi:hypothetical protein